LATPEQESINNHAAFIWSVADLLRGDYKQSEYGRVILPFTVLRRLDCVLEPTKEQVLKRYRQIGKTTKNTDPVLCRVAEQKFFNTSPFDLNKLLDDPDKIADNTRAYIAGFSESARDLLEHFDFDTQIRRLDRANILYRVVARVAQIDLHPDAVSNVEMGYIYEELIRKFAQLSNDTAGEHFTPREVIRLMVELIFAEDLAELSKPGVKRRLFDPACGTGGMLSVAEGLLRELNPDVCLEVFGQELNPETYATCRADMLLKDHDSTHIAFGNSFSDDGFEGETFDYMLANPPFGVEWKKVEKGIRQEAETKGFAGRFGAGLPRINDGSFLFLQHMISKMKSPGRGGSRLAIVFNGSPLFTGGAGSGESEIRRWIIENDWLDAIVALPDQLFYNTGISTYFWIVTNRKSAQRRGKVQLIDARGLWTKMPKSLGSKRKRMDRQQIAEITRLYTDFEQGEHVKIFPNEAFGFMRVTVERPLRAHYEVTTETLAAVEAAKQVAALDGEARERLMTGLRGLRGERFAFDAEELKPRLADLVADLPKPKSLEKTLLGALIVRDRDDPIVTDRNGDPEPDPELRDHENVPLPTTSVAFKADPSARLGAKDYRRAVSDFMETEVLPYEPDAWVDHDKTKIGYEIPLTRYFYKYVPPRQVEQIDAEIKQLEREIQELLHEVTA
jgi:type I restriction enzyme M protein